VVGNAEWALLQLANAAAAYEASYTIWRDTAGAGNPQTLRAQFNLAQLYKFDTGLAPVAKVDALYREVLELGRSSFGEGHPTLATFRMGYAQFLLKVGRNAAALGVLSAPDADAALAKAGPQTREGYAAALLQALDRLRCPVASNRNTGLDRARVLEELPLIRALRCPTDPQVGSGS
jgi:hypothetical protein